MIIILNGSFGVGKTSTALALSQRIPGAHLFDPEDVGHFVRYLTAGLRHGAEDTNDFQDIRIWPAATVATARLLYDSYARPLIVPMTLVNPKVLEPIRTGLSTIAPVYHFCLVASLATIQRRLQARGEKPGSWPWQKAAQYVPQLADPSYAVHIDTEQQAIPEVVEHLLSHLPER